jgi:hypothetical protein
VVAGAASGKVAKIEGRLAFLMAKMGNKAWQESGTSIICTLLGDIGAP